MAKVTAVTSIAPIMGKFNDSCRSPINYNASDFPGTDFTPQTDQPDDPSLSRTSQEYAEESNPNYIVSNYLKKGIIPEAILNKREAIYADVSDLGTYKDAQEKIIRINEAFLTLDADIREQFNNDPGQMIDFLADPANLDEAIKIGLLPEKAAAVVDPAEAADPAAKAPVVTPGATPPVAK